MMYHARFRCLAGMGMLAMVCLVAAAELETVHAQQCRLDYGSHGTFREVPSGQGRCLKFVDDLGTEFEVLNPRGAWRDGMTGTLLAEFRDENVCTDLRAIRICSFQADFTKKVTGTLVFRTLIECPGYIIATSSQDYRIENCEDYGDTLCNEKNLHRKIQAEVFVDTSFTICLGLARSTVLDFRFIP